MKKLSTREMEMLVMLSNGKTYRDLKQHFSIQAANVHNHVHHIRQKTGIHNTRDPRECRAAVRLINQQRMSDARKPLESPAVIMAQQRKRRNGRPPTRRQIEILRLVVKGQTSEQIAGWFGIQPQSVQNLAYQGTQRMGIHNAGKMRLPLIAQWLEAYDGGPEEPADPMQDPAF